MKNKKPIVILLPALLILIFAAAACAPRDTGALTTAASAVSTSADVDNRETSPNAAQTGESTQAATSAVSSAVETSVTASTTQAQPATTAPAQTLSTTCASAGYAEWTYRNKLGSTVTYSENPDNPYIRLVSRQMGIPPDRLSASFWSQGAAVFVFRSADRNTDTLDTAYFILAKDMEVFSLNGSAAQAEFSTFSRQTAVSLYSMALDHRP